jgi:hypothetical protein
MTFPFGGNGPTGITVDALTESYNAIWSKPTLDIGKYRLQVVVPVTFFDGDLDRTMDVQLGSVDLQVVSKKKDPVDPGFVAVVKGSPIPVKFRIETGTVGLILVFPLRQLPVGSSWTYDATVFDLHGQTMSLPVTWTTSNSAIATVDADGTVHGLSVGNVRIIATCGGVSQSVLLRIVAVT